MLVVSVAAMAIIVSAGTAQLVVGKDIANLHYGVVDKELTIRYSIFNIGDG